MKLGYNIVNISGLNFALIKIDQTEQIELNRNDVILNNEIKLVKQQLNLNLPIVFFANIFDVNIDPYKFVPWYGGDKNIVDKILKGKIQFQSPIIWTKYPEDENQSYGIPKI